ncbi:MAG: hypothetical protein JWQ88_2904 [Rhodoferax sp.]|nr:hypothetical protein [Rhodoferax sp.]
MDPADRLLLGMSQRFRLPDVRLGVLRQWHLLQTGQTVLVQNVRLVSMRCALDHATDEVATPILER